VGVILGLVGGVVAPGAASVVGWVVTLVGVFAPLGFVGGAVFSVVLGTTEGRRRFDQMSLPRFAAWGAVGGAPGGAHRSGIVLSRAPITPL